MLVSPIFQNLSKDPVIIILSYDGRIKYRKGLYINCISIHDERYNLITPILDKKRKIISDSFTSISDTNNTNYLKLYQSSFYNKSFFF